METEAHAVSCGVLRFGFETERETIPELRREPRERTSLDADGEESRGQDRVPRRRAGFAVAGRIPGAAARVPELCHGTRPQS